MRKLIAGLALAAILASNPAAADQRGAAGRLVGKGVTANLRQAQSLINNYRRAYGLPPLRVDARLTAAAQAHSNDMARHDRMSHNVSFGGLQRRMGSSGLRPQRAAENVSAGYRSTTRAIDGWKKSPAHNRNLLMSGVSRMGFAAAYRPNSRYKYYWTLILAAE